MILKPLSKSTYSVFLVCPFRAHAFKNLGFERPSNFMAQRGKLIHTLREKIEDGELTLEDAISQTDDPEMANLLERTVLNDPFHGPEFQKMTEAHVKIDAEGNCVETDDEAAAYGYLDQVVFLPDELLVDDLKTGMTEYDDVFERHLYAGLLAKAAQPEYERIRFVRYFCRSGNRYEYLYEWRKRKNGSTSLHVTDPSGKRSQIRGKNSNPLVDYLQKVLKKIDRTSPRPRPGSHCRNWFGSPCDFRGNVCPLTRNLPQIVPVSGEAHQAEPLIKYAFLAFLKNSDPDFINSMSHDLASMAYDAVLQLEAGIKEVEKKLKMWAETNGPINLHEESYGWHFKQDIQIDKEKALEILLTNNLTYSDISRAINISRSSVEKLPKALAEIKNQILSSSRPQLKKTFGLLGGKNAQIGQ
mgnify:FL=1